MKGVVLAEYSNSILCNDSSLSLARLSVEDIVEEQVNRVTRTHTRTAATARLALTLGRQQVVNAHLLIVVPVTALHRRLGRVHRAHQVTKTHASALVPREARRKGLLHLLQRNATISIGVEPAQRAPNNVNAAMLTVIRGASVICVTPHVHVYRSVVKVIHGAIVSNLDGCLG